MHSSSYLIVVFILFSTSYSISAVCAEVYRCVRNDGHVSYQQIRCHQNSKPLALNRHRSGWTALRSGEQALLDSYRKNDTASKEKVADAKPEHIKEPKSCLARQSQLDTVKLKLRQGYKLKESNKLHRQRDDHKDYLRRFCAR